MKGLLEIVKRRIVCLCISLALLIAMVPSTSAADRGLVVTEFDEYILDTYDSYILSIRGEDYSNGDTCFYMLENGKTVYKSYVDRSTSQVITTDYQRSIPLTTRQTVCSQYDTSTPTTYTGSYTYAGKIGYDHYAQGMVMTTNYLNMSYNSETMRSSFDANGKYRNYAALAGVIASALTLPESLALKTAAKALACFGFTVKAIDIVIPTHMVSALKTTVTWKAVNANISSQSVTKWGSYYVSTQDGCTDTSAEMDYWPVSSYKSHNTAFASVFYPLVFKGYDRFEIVSWT